MDAKTSAFPFAARSGNSRAGSIDFDHAIGDTVAFERHAIRAKRIAENDPAAGIDISPRHRFDFLGVCEIPQIRAISAFQAERLQVEYPTRRR